MLQREFNYSRDGTVPDRSNGGEGRESWDGKSIYYQVGSSGEGLYVRALAGGPERKVLDSVPDRGYAITREGIYYLGKPAADGSSPLQLFDPVTSKSRLLATLHEVVRVGPVPLSVSPDGSVLYTVDTKDRNADLRLVEHFR